MTDLATLQAELEDAEEAFAESQALRRRLESQEQLVAGTEAELRAARASLDDERGDVAALESFSPTRIWAALRGTRVADLDREQAEVRAAEYAVARIELRHRELTEERTRLEGRLLGLGRAAERREKALAAKEAFLTEAGGEAGERLTALATELGATRAELTEVSEAIDAATAAGTILAEAVDMLGRAQDWAGADTFWGGGMLTDSLKYDRMDQANRLLRQADVALARLTEELGDLGRAGVTGPQVDGLTRTFDVWFDNIFSDWSVKRRIDDAAERTARALHDVASVRRSLLARRTELSETVRDLRARRDTLLRG